MRLLPKRQNSFSPAAFTETLLPTNTLNQQDISKLISGYFKVNGVIVANNTYLCCSLLRFKASYMIIQRKIISAINFLVDKYPIIAVTGPRQSGKTTLLKYMFPEYRYVSL